MVQQWLEQPVRLWGLYGLRRVLLVFDSSGTDAANRQPRLTGKKIIILSVLFDRDFDAYPSAFCSANICSLSWPHNNLLYSIICRTMDHELLPTAAGVNYALMGANEKTRA